MRESVFRLLTVLFVVAFIAFAAGCSDSGDDNNNGGDTDTVAEQNEETDGDAVENVETEGDELTEGEGEVEGTTDGDEAEEPDTEGTDGDVEEGTTGACANDPCGNNDDPYRTVCVEDSNAENGYRCECVDGYELLDFNGTKLCEPVAGECGADFEVTFDEDGKYSNTSDTTEKDNDVIIDPDNQDAACQDARYLMLGFDEVYSVQLEANDYLKVHVVVDSAQSEKFDPAIYIISECQTRATCAKGVDANGDAGDETLEFSAPEAGTYFIVVDSAYACTGGENSTLDYCRGAYTIEIEKSTGDACHPNPCTGGSDPHRTVCVLDENEDTGYVCTCEEGYGLIDVPGQEDKQVCWEDEVACDADFTVEFDENGHYENAASTADAGNDVRLFWPDEAAHCDGVSWDFMGYDHTYAVELTSMDILSIELTVDTEATPKYDPAVYIIDECTNWAYCLSCSDSGGDGEGESLTFQPENDGTYFIVVDSGYEPEGQYAENAYGSYSISIDKSTAAVCVADNTIDANNLPFGSNTPIDNDSQKIDGSCMGTTFAGPDRAYDITLTQGQKIYISADPADDADMDVAIYVLPANCATAGAGSVCLDGVNRYGNGGKEQMVFEAPEDGTYFIVVDTTSEDAHGNVSISVKNFTPVACTIDTDIPALPYEANGSTADPADDSIALAWNGEYGVGPDNIYKVHLTANEKIEVSVSPVDEGANLVAMLVKPEDCITNNPGDAIMAGEHFVYTSPEEADYLIVVDSFDGSSGAYVIRVNDFAPVDCSADVNVADADMPFEGTGSFTNADVSVTSFADCGTSEDKDVVYALEAKADYIYTITVTPNTDGALKKIFVLSTCIGNDNTMNECAGSSSSSPYVFVPEEDGTYFVVVKGTEGDFTINITKEAIEPCSADQTIDLTSVTLPYEDGFDTSTLPAGRFSSNSCVGYPFRGRELILGLTVAEGKAYKFTVSQEENGSLDTAILIIDGDACYGNAFELSQCLGSADNGLDGDAETLVYEFDHSGDYFLIVETYASEGQDPTGEFILKIEDLTGSASAAEECSMDAECAADSTTGECLTADNEEYPVQFCSKECTTDEDCSEFVSGCCLVDEGICSVAAGCGEAGATAQTGEACAFNGVDVNLPTCAPREDGAEVTCLGSSSQGVSFCSRRCDPNNDNCGEDFEGGCCVDLGFLFPDPWCVPAEFCQ